jgi:hypothetical protein
MFEDRRTTFSRLSVQVLHKMMPPAPKQPYHRAVAGDFKQVDGKHLAL